MLRSGAGRLSKGAASATTLVSDTLTVAVVSCRHPSLASTPSRPFRRSEQPSIAQTFGQHVRRSGFHSASYFSASQPELVQEQTGSPSSTGRLEASQPERFLPPLLDTDLTPCNDAQQHLFTAIQHLDADRSWHLYKQLGKARFDLPASVINLLITLQCRKPVRGSPSQVINSQAALRDVCDRVLLLCRERARYHVGCSIDSSSSADDSGLSTLSAPLSLRLLYLLVVEEEQIAASRSTRPLPRRKHLSRILNTLSANLDACPAFAEDQVDIQLRGRLASTLSRLGSTDDAYRQLRLLIEHASHETEAPFIDPRPFDQLLAALAKQEASISRRPEFLPSPVDLSSRAIDEGSLILRALRLTLVSQVQASKANIHKCLQALDSATLWWLLPFELDGDTSSKRGSKPLPDDRYDLKAKWHPWQSSDQGKPISQDFLDSFAERVALVLAQRGILQPALHIFNGLQSSKDDSTKLADLSPKIPDHDLFTVVLEKLAERMAADNLADARKSLDTHRGLSFDLHLAIKVYTLAHTIGVDLDPRLNEAVLRALAFCLPSAIVDLGPARSRFTNVKPQIAQRNEDHGSRQALQIYLRRFSSIIFRIDPDLSNGSLTFPAQATLLGLHMRTRDYISSKRLYQLIRLREPERELWSSQPEAESLRSSALHPLAAPDQDAFMWLFANSLRGAKKPTFAVRLYLDWLASGNTLPSRLTGVFVRALLRAGHTSVVQRVFQELQEKRVVLSARLVRSLVISFAEAGFPELAVEMASNTSQLAVATGPYQKAGASMDASQQASSSWLLGSTLNLMSMAMDRSSRALSSQDDDSHRKVLRLFDEFRLGLTHHLLGATHDRDEHLQPQSQSQRKVTLGDIRMAYNASMRAYLSHIMGAADGLASLAGQEGNSASSAVQSTCEFIEMLFKELQDLGVEPDSETWTLRLTSYLHAFFTAPTSPEQRQRLHESLEVFELASDRTYTADGPLPGLGSQSTSMQEHTLQVRVRAEVAAALIDACRRCSDLRSGLGVYDRCMRQGGDVDVHIEKARLMLLAALSEPNKWRDELDRLVSRNKRAFQHNDRFVKQLQALSNGNAPRKLSGATGRSK